MAQSMTSSQFSRGGVMLVFPDNRIRYIMELFYFLKMWLDKLRLFITREIFASLISVNCSSSLFQLQFLVLKTGLSLPENCSKNHIWEISPGEKFLLKRFFVLLQLWNQKWTTVFHKKARIETWTTEVRSRSKPFVIVTHSKSTGQTSQFLFMEKLLPDIQTPNHHKQVQYGLVCFVELFDNPG